MHRSVLLQELTGAFPSRHIGLPRFQRDGMAGGREPFPIAGVNESLNKSTGPFTDMGGGEFHCLLRKIREEISDG